MASGLALKGNVDQKKAKLGPRMAQPRRPRIHTVEKPRDGWMGKKERRWTQEAQTCEAGR